MTTITDREAWVEAVNALGTQVTEWVPEGVECHKEAFSENPDARVLVFSREGRRVTLSPAVWDQEHLPTSVDLFSNWGQRIRFRGPNGRGEWDVYTSDGLLLPTTWNRGTVATLLDGLLAA